MAAIGMVVSWQAALWLPVALPPERIEPNTVTYNGALSASFEMGSWRCTLHLLAQVPADSVDVITYNASIRSCQDPTAWQLPRLLLCSMQLMALAADVFTCNLMLRNCGDGQWERAWASLFCARWDNVEADVIGFNSLIHACAKDKVWSGALSLLSLACQSGLEASADPKGINPVISACRGKSWVLALQFFRRLQSQRIISKVSYGAIISAFDETEWARALYLAAFAGPPSRQNTVIQNSALLMCGWRRAWSMLSMLSSTASPSKVSFSSALGSGRRGVAWPLALCFLVWMLACRATPDRITQNTALDICRLQGRWKRCMALLDLCREKKYQARSIIYTSDACVKSGSWENAQLLLQELGPSNSVASSLSILAARSGMWQASVSMFRRMCLYRIQATSAAYHGVMATSQDWRTAQQVLTSMLGSKVRTSLSTYAAATQVWKLSSKWDLALQLHAGDEAICADVVLQNAIVDACGKLHKWQVTVCMLASMASASLRARPDVLSYNSCLDACEKGRKWQVGVSLLSIMCSEGPHPEAASAEAVLAACERCSRWQHSLQVLANVGKLSNSCGDDRIPRAWTFGAGVEGLSKSGQQRKIPSLLDQLCSLVLVGLEGLSVSS